MPYRAITFEEREALPYDEKAVMENMKVKAHSCSGISCPGHQIKILKNSEKEENNISDETFEKGYLKSRLSQWPVQIHSCSGISCPGHQIKILKNSEKEENNISDETFEKGYLKSRLSQWPVQIKLVPVNAPFFENANLLVAADCTAFAYGNFHNEFIKNHITLIGCPKLDSENYTEKLTEILKLNNIKSLKIVKMEVPCNLQRY